jgi:hypothetical protein
MTMTSAAAEQGPLITYTVFKSVNAREKTEYADLPWIELVRTIANPAAHIAKTSCPLLSLCEYGDEPNSSGALRYGENVKRVYGVELDYDGEEVSLEEGHARMQAAGLTGVLYTSASYTDGAPRWRALLPLSEPAAPMQRAMFVARANRALGGIASRESFTLSQSYYFGQVRGAKYKWLESHGRCIDQAVDLEPLYFKGQNTDPKTGRDTRSNQQLLEAFARGDGRYEAMLKLSSRWAARGMGYDDIVSTMNDLFDKGSSLNADGIDLRSRIEPMAASAVRKYGGTMPEVRVTAVPEPPADLPKFDASEYADIPEAQGMIRSVEPDVPKAVAPSTTSGRRLVLRAINEIVSERREATWLIHNVIEANVLAVLAGPRASFKSFIALDWAMRIAVADNPVVILSGEGAGLGRRVEAWMQEHGKGRDLEELRLMALESVANLNAEEEMLMLQQAIDQAGIRPALVIVDTFSKFSAGLDENSNQEVAEYLSKLTIGLRERYTATVLLVAHSGHGDAKRPRGASALMANPDAEYIVQRPDVQGMGVTVTRERFKDTASLAPLGYEAVEVSLGRTDRYGEQVKSLVMRNADTIVATRRVEPAGKVQKVILEALRARQKGSESPIIWTMADLRQVGKECGQSKQSVHKAVEAMAMSPFLTSTIGGFRLSEEGLK